MHSVYSDVLLHNHTAVIKCRTDTILLSNIQLVFKFADLESRVNHPLYLVVKYIWFPLIWNSSSYLLWHWLFWRVQGSCFIECLSIWVCLIVSSWLDLGYAFLAGVLHMSCCVFTSVLYEEAHDIVFFNYWWCWFW